VQLAGAASREKPLSDSPAAAAAAPARYRSLSGG